MAVYTRVERGELENLVGALSLGELVSFEGVADGLENTTYFLRTRKFGGPVGVSDEWVLTVLESADYTCLGSTCSGCCPAIRGASNAGLPATESCLHPWRSATKSGTGSPAVLRKAASVTTNGMPV